MNQLAIDITHRTTVGKKVKKLRQNGKIPIRLFGGGIDPMPMQADASSLGKILSQAGFNSPIFVNFDSSKEDKPNLINPGDTVIFKEITLDQYKNFNE